MNNEQYNSKTDEELIVQLRAGDDNVMDYLMEKYKNLVRMKANTMFLLGGDTDDLIQEGMIGLFKAVRDFKPDRDSSFATFASICITRQIYKAVEAASRKKHGPLNTYVSLSVEDDTEGNGPLQEHLKASSLDNPENMLINQEEMEQFLEELNRVLSPMERQVLHLHLAGNNYHQIAQILGKSEKSIDNALQRMKQKISKLRDK
ncbi:MAG: RNA polymerase sporulation sigma factor SigH [Eubacterium sp.]|nr:RNA polymerase sporulation sigma factor SigH [Eubacterium sp.]